ncbi:histone-lysine N-methyltransferase SETMAR [Trichonephila clavipes]|nr:histone-lysine N-methyltransferase SETMAR [Trichonephila clavipes]
MAVQSISREVSIKQFQIYARCQEIIEVDSHVSSRSIAQELKVDHNNSFKPFVQSWIQKEARCLGVTPTNTKNLMDRISICEALAKENEINPFLKRMILNSGLNCQQLDYLKLAIDQKRPELANRSSAVFHQYNARPPTSVVNRQKLWDLDWKFLMHPPYSPYLAPNDYHLFLALQNFQNDKKL